MMERNSAASDMERNSAANDMIQRDLGEGKSQRDEKEADERCKRERLAEEVARMRSQGVVLREQARRLHRQADMLSARARRLSSQAGNLMVRANLPEVKNVRDVAQRQAAEKLVHGLFRDVLAVLTEGRLRLCETADELPPILELPCDPIPLTRTDGLRELRRQARQEALGLGLTEDRWGDLVTASQEAGMNAVVHAGGGTGRLSTNGRNTVQVRVEDQGRGIAVEHLPRALLEKGYSTAETLGFGMKMMLLLADRIWLLTGSTGTTIVLEQDRMTPAPPWL